MAKKILFRKSELNTKPNMGDRNTKAKVRIDWKKLREMKSWPKEKKDEFFDKKAQEVRAEWRDRWLKYYPDPNSIDGLDHRNPYLEVEWAMCDFRFLWRVSHKNKKVVERALEGISPEAREVYLYGTGHSNSKPYYEVSINGSMWKALKDSVGIKGKKTEDEMEDILNEMYGEDGDDDKDKD